MARAWIVRSLRATEYEHLAFSQGLAAVGWGNVGDLSNRSREQQIRKVVRAGYPFVENDSTDAYTEQLVEFRAIMARGDIVLLLRRSSPDVAIGTIIGDYAYRTDLDPAVRHVRAVRWARTDLPRAAVESELAGIPALRMVFAIEQAEVVDRLRVLLESGEPAVEQAVSAGWDLPERAEPFAKLQRNLNLARSLATAGQYLAHLDPRSFDVLDVFRSAWVQGVAALDFWVRGEVRSRMLLLARQPSVDKPKKYVDFSIPLGEIERFLRSEATLEELIDNQLTQARGHLAYQHPDKIRDAFALVGNTSGLWNKVAKVLNERAEEDAEIEGSDVHQQLVDIVHRRNKIAHEYDEDLEHPPAKRAIDAATVTQVLDWIEQLAEAILAVLDGG